ncbi:MAG: hypothetical protein HKN12_12395 [Gemmatimonadetes bacterium]|nr:hypothetical protein [Gemmatimonadota bacterium]
MTMQEAGISQLVSVKLGKQDGDVPDFDINVDEDGNEIAPGGSLVAEGSA